MTIIFMATGVRIVTDVGVVLFDAPIRKIRKAGRNCTAEVVVFS